MSLAETIQSEEYAPSRALSTAPDAFAEHVTFGFTTIDRRETAFDAVRIVRRHFPNSRLIVVDQNGPTEDASTFYAEHGVDVRFVEYDIGLSAARNIMFRECPTRYFFMLDDDVVELPASEIRKSFEVIGADERVLVVGGRSGKIIEGKNGTEERRANPPFNYFMFRKPEARFALLFDPGVLEDIPTPRYDRDTNYRIAETVENFGLFDVEKYRELDLSWDDDLKIVAEHLDFYLGLQEKTRDRTDTLVVSNPRLIAYDLDAVTNQAMAAYRKKRFRQSFRNLFVRKWDIAAEMHLGKWINIHWKDDQFSTVRWAELQAFGERQRAAYRKEGLENIRRHAGYPIGRKRLSFIATTVDRFDTIQALALSIRVRYGDAVEILLGVQCENLPDGLKDCAEALDVVLVPMEYDIGLSAARNRLVEHLQTDYFVLCDDDFVIDDGFHIANAVRILDEEPDVTGVGGFYRDVLYNPAMAVERVAERHFTFQAMFEPRSGTLIRVPFHHLPVAACYDPQRGALPADILQNLAVFRTSAFGPSALHWDERMKISGEHLDFYVKNLLQDKKTFLFDPGLSVLHNRIHNTAYRQKRSRDDGIRLFYRKWGVNHEIDTELGTRAPSRGETRWRSFTETGGGGA